MRIKHLGIFAAMGLLFGATSCNDDVNIYDGGLDGDLVQVSFTIDREGGVLTRTRGNVTYPTAEEFPQISDGSKATRLIWSVYDNEGNQLPSIAENYSENHETNTSLAGPGQVVEDVENFPHTITLTLVRGQQYSFAFWAQDPKTTAFNTKDLKAVSIDYKTAPNNLNNDELRDAFCKVETFTVSSADNAKRTIILTRPLSQINVGIPKEEYEAMLQSNVRIQKSKIHIENVATEFNVVANAANSSDPTKRQAIDYEYNWIPAYYNFFKDGNLSALPSEDELADAPEGKEQYLRIDLDHDNRIEAYGLKNKDKKDETYKYLLMCYVLPADRNDGTSTYSTTLDKVEFAVLPEKEGQEEIMHSLTNVPVQRNWRTNIFGSIYTSQIQLEIDLDPIYSGDYNYPNWERIYEGVTYDAINKCITISNGAGLKWLSKATNGEWSTKEAFESDDTHNVAGANLANNAALFLKAVNLEEWPADGIFHFLNVNIKLAADIDLKAYGQMFANKDDYQFTPIANGDRSEFNEKLGSEFYDAPGLKWFAGNFDGQNHTIYNLKTVRPEGITDMSPFGLFGIAGRQGYIKNVRLKNIDIEGHYDAGAVVGLVYSSVPAWEPEAYDAGGFHIENCYVDGGTINITSGKVNEVTYDNANNVGGIAGYINNRATVKNCNVRNLTIRAYRKLSGIVGQIGGDYGPAEAVVTGCSVNDVVLIADMFQEYGDNGLENKNYDIKDFFVAAPNGAQVYENTERNNKLYVFNHNMEGEQRVTTIEEVGLLSNPPLDIFPRLVRYTDVVNIKTSLLGGPSAWKEYSGDEKGYHGGTPVASSGRVGLWISGITINGDTTDNEDLLDNATVTASGVEGENDCVIFIKDAAVIKNLTVHGATYANEGISLSPASGETVKLDKVYAYDARRVLTDDGNGNEGILEVTDSNFRGYVKLGTGYTSITFTGTTFDGSTKRAEETTNKLEIQTPGATLTDCVFVVEPGSDYEIDAQDAIFNSCKAYATGDPDNMIDINGNGTLTVGDDGKVNFQ